MTYNCETKEIVIPLMDEPSISVTTLYVVKTCCGTPVPYNYCNTEQSNLLNVGIVVDNLWQVKEEPEFDCYIEATWDENISIDLSDVVSFSGIKESYISSVLINTETIDLSYFNTTHSVYTSISDAERAYIFKLEFTLSNGIIINYEVKYSTKVETFSDENCLITGFDLLITYDYECLNNFTIDEQGIHFPLSLTDGYYSASWGDISGCFIVECEESLACKVKNFIEEKFNKNCYGCNKKKDLETYMKLLMYYKAFKSDCLDCCERCNAYEKIINITKGCYDC